MWEPLGSVGFEFILFLYNVRKFLKREITFKCHSHFPVAVGKSGACREAIACDHLEEPGGYA